MAVVELKDIRFSWGTNPPVLDLPEFSLARGERVFLRGPSGSGKTTLLGIIGGVLQPSGTVKVLDTDLFSLSSSRRDGFRADHVGFIFQMFNLLPYLSLIDNVLLPCRFSARRREKAATRGPLAHEARRLLGELGLEGEKLLSRPVTDLSVGQQQRVAAARALIGSPELLIADEPTSALDADAREAFIRLLFKECEEMGATLLFVSHDGSLASLFSRQISLKELNRASGGDN